MNQAGLHVPDEVARQMQAQQAAIQFLNSIAIDIYTRNVKLDTTDAVMADTADKAKRAALVFAKQMGMIRDMPPSNDTSAAEDGDFTEEADTKKVTPFPSRSFEI